MQLPPLLVLVATTLTPAVALADTFTGTGYELEIAVPKSARTNAASELALTLTPTNGRHLNQEFPIKIAIAAPGDVVVPKSTLGRSDARAFDEGHAVFAIGVTPKAAGDRAITLDVKFAVCSSTACEPQRRSVVVSLHVQ